MDYENIFALERAAASAIYPLLEAYGIPTHVQQGEGEMSTPRVEYRLIVGKVTGHYSVNTDGKAVPDAWHVSHHFRIVTNRVQNDPYHHARFISKVRWFMCPFAAQFSSVNMPNHVFSVVHESGTTPGIDDHLGQDISEVTFDGVMSIRSSAWSS